MSDFEIVQIPMLKDNYGYLLIDHETGTTAMVDASEAEPVLSVLQKRKLPLHYILCTHHHLDHTGGNKQLKTATGCKIVSSPSEKSKIPGVTVEVSEGEEFKIGQTSVKIMEIPGHTLGALAFYIPDEQAVFCGDTLFSLGCGRLFESTAEQMWNSLRRLAELPRITKVFCGHEYTEANGRFALSVDPNNSVLKDYCHHVSDLRKNNIPTIPSTLEIEVEANPFLRAPLLVKSLGLTPGTLPHMAFAEIRKRKDLYLS